MGLNCSVVNKHFYDIVKSIDDFAKSEKNKSYFKDPLEAAVKLFETEFKAGLDEVRQVPDLTIGQASSFKARLKELSESVSKGQIDSKFAQVFWQTSHLGKKDPVIGSVLRNMQRSGFYFRANELRDKNLVKSLFGSLMSESLNRGLSTKLGIKNANKEIQRLDDAWISAIVKWKNKEKGAQDELFRVRGEIDRLVSSTHLKVYDEMITMIEGTGKEVNGKMVWDSGLPKLAQDKYNKLSSKDKKLVDDGKKTVRLTDSDLAKLKMLDGSNITPDMYRSIESYSNLMDGLYKTLRNGVEKRIDSIVKKLEYNGDNLSSSEMKEFKDRLRGKLMPKYETGFFPHYTRDLNISLMDGLMPFFDSMQDAVNPYDKSKKKKSMRTIINDMNSYISGHAKRRAKDLERGDFDYQYSRNLFSSINNYVTDVNRFNFQSYMDAHILDGLMSVEQIFKSDGMAKGYAESLSNYIIDLHVASNGSTKLSDTSRNAMRTLLSFEFISKLGLNPRGATRNAFQRLLDYVTWGPVQIKRMKDYIGTLSFKGSSSDAYIEGALKKAGLLFEEATPELIESGLTGRGPIFKTISWNDADGKYESHKRGRLENVANKVSTLAAKSSWLHRKAENMNRKHTFKIGFAQMHRWLNTPDYKNKLIEQASETEIGKARIKEGKAALTDAEIDSRIRKKAENYAVNMVVMNHFDYADYAKSKMMRSNIGRFMFQFQHYSMEFFERNLSIAREAKHDILNGKLLPTGEAQGLQQAYRMSFVYFIAPLIASALTGVNFGNIIEHDTSQRLNQLATLMTGDEDEIKEAFYGKGPIISTFGGPITSDLIDIGVMLDLINLDDDSILTLITGLEQYDPSNQSSTISKKIRLLNTFAGRVYERHIPQLKEGRIGWALQQELGLYPTAEARKTQRKTKQALPPEIAKALENLSSGI